MSNRKTIKGHFVNERYDKAFSTLSKLLDRDGIEYHIDWIVAQKFPKNPTFWKRGFGMQYFEGILKSNQLSTFLDFYFQQSTISVRPPRSNSTTSTYPYMDIPFLTKVSESHLDLLMDAVRTNQAFLKRNHLESLDFLQYHPSQEAKDFYRTIKYLYITNAREKKRLHQYDKDINSYSIDDLIIHFALFLEKKKWASANNIEALNDGFQPQLHPYISGFVNVLKRRKSRNIATIKDEETFLKRLITIINEKIEKNPSYERLDLIFQKYGEYQRFYHSVLASFSYDDNYEAIWRKDKMLVVKPKELNKHHNYEKNGYKYQYWLNYHLWQGRSLLEDYVKEGFVKIIGNDEQHRTMNETAQFSTIAYSNMLKEYSIGSKIKNGKNYFNPYLSLKIAELYGANLKARYLQPMLELSQNSTQSYLLNILQVLITVGKNKGALGLPIRWDNYHELQEKTYHAIQNGNIMDYKSSNPWEKPSEEELDNALDAIILDISNTRNIPYDLYESPILKIGNICYTFSTLLGDGNVFHLMNSLLYKKNNKNKQYNSSRTNDINQEIKKVAAQVENWFSTIGYQAISELEFKNKDYEGDMDCLALKDDTLFIIELKSTYNRTTLRAAHDYKKTLHKAGKQLKKIENYIKDYYEEFKTTLNGIIDLPEDYKALKLYPIVVSTTFEHDYKLFNNYKKISLFELKIILEDSKSALLLARANDMEWMQKKYLLNEINISGQGFQSNDYAEIIKDLVKDSSNHSFYQIGQKYAPAQIIEAIEKDKVWDFLDDKDYSEINAQNVSYQLMEKGSNFKEHHKLYQLALHAYHDLSDYHAALRYIEKALAIIELDIYYELQGNAYGCLRNTISSISSLQKAYKLNPQNSVVCTNLASSYAEFGDSKNAFMYFEKAIQLDRSNHHAYFNRGLLYLQIGYLDFAKRDFTTTIRINPSVALKIKAVLRGDVIKDF